MFIFSEFIHDQTIIVTSFFVKRIKAGIFSIILFLTVNERAHNDEPGILG